MLVVAIEEHFANVTEPHYRNLLLFFVGPFRINLHPLLNQLLSNLHREVLDVLAQ